MKNERKQHQSRKKSKQKKKTASVQVPLETFRSPQNSLNHSHLLWVFYLLFDILGFPTPLLVLSYKI